MTKNGFIEDALSRIDVQKLKSCDEHEQQKFRSNIAKYVSELFKVSLKEKSKRIRLIKTGVFSLVSGIPVITPVITALLQVITGEDLGEKMDTMIGLQLEHGKKIRHNYWLAVKTR